MLSCIVAMDENGAIGIDNKLPWHLPADLKRFKALTTGHAVLMGRKTYESIGKPLPNRKNIVLTRHRDVQIEGCLVAHSIEEALKMASGDVEPFLLGGAELFAQALPLVQRIYLTVVHTRVKGDAFFPELDPKQWNILEEVRHEPDEKNPFTYTYRTLQRR